MPATVEPQEIRDLASALSTIMPEISDMAKNFKQAAEGLGDMFECPAYDKILEVCDQIDLTIKSSTALTEAACVNLNKAADALEAGAGIA